MQLVGSKDEISNFGIRNSIEGKQIYFKIISQNFLYAWTFLKLHENLDLLVPDNIRFISCKATSPTK